MSDATVRLTIIGDSDRAIRAVSSFDRSLAGLGRTSRIAAGALAGTLGGALVYAVKKAADLESQLNTFQATAKASAREMDQVGRLAKRLGNDMKLPGVSALDAAAAMTELAKGGLSVKDAMKAARSTLQLATVAQVSHARAAEITANALNAFSLSGDKATHVVDLLANASVAAQGSIDDMALALQQSSAVAVQAGLSIDQTVTAISVLAKNSLQGSDAGTSLRTMLISLMAPTETASKVLKKYNIDLRDSQGHLKPLPRIIQELRGDLSGLSDAQRDAALKTIFGNDALRAANILLKTSPKAWREMAGAVTEAGGAQRLANARMRGFNGALEAFKSAVETTAISVGTKLLPALTNMFGVLGDLAGSKSLDDLAGKLEMLLFGGVDKRKIVKPKVDLDFTGTKIVGGPKELLGMIDPGTGQRRMRVAVPIDLKTNRADIQAMNALMKNLEKARGAPLDGPGRTGLVKVEGFVQKLSRAIGDAWGKVNWSAVWGKAFDVAGDFGKKMLDAGKQIVKGALEGDWDKVGEAAALAIVGGLATKKILGKLGVTGALGGLFGLGGRAIGGVFGGRSGVVPVFVTNPGFGGATPVPGGKTGLGRVASTVLGALGVVGLGAAAVTSGPNDRAFGFMPFGQGPSLESIFKWWGRPGATKAAATPPSMSAGHLSGAAAGPFLALANSTQDFEAAAKRAERTGKGSFQRIADAASVAAGAIAAIKPKSVNVKANTNPRAVKGLQDAIDATTGKTVSVRAAVDLGPLREFAQMLRNLPTEKRVVLQSVMSGPRRASGGTIPGSYASGDVVPAMLSGEEVVLNPQQQRMAGPGIMGALGKILRATGAPMDGFKYARGKRTRTVGSTVGAARDVLKAVADINQREDNLDRAYGQMTRDFGRSQEVYVTTDEQGNETRDEGAISTRIGEIDQLLASRQDKLALIDEEKRQLELAIRRLDDAISRLLAEIKEARSKAEAERASAVALAQKITSERRKSNPDEKKIDRWDTERKRHLTFAGRYDARVTSLTGTLSDMRAGKQAARFDLDNVIGFERKDVELDIADLRLERDDVRNAKARASSSSTAGGPDTSALLAEVGRLRLALGIQDAQLPIIGSFAKGALYVPNSGLAMVHAGERIIPAGDRTSAGSGGGGPVVVTVQLGGGLEMLADFIDARVIGEGADRVAVQIGQRADTLRREGRY